MPHLPRLRLFFELICLLTMGGRCLCPPAAASDALVSDVNVTPQTNLAELVASMPKDTRFIFEPGTYRISNIAPKDDDSFIAPHGAVISGAQPLTNFTKRDVVYETPLNLVAGPRNGGCAPGRLCDIANDLFIDDARQEPVARLENVRPGTFFWDSAAKKIYIGIDPDGKTVEIAAGRLAFLGTAERVTIEGFVIEKFANAAQVGAIGDQGHPTGWTIRHCEIRYNHGVGINIGSDGKVLQNSIHHNGQLGINASGVSIEVSRNNLFQNNQAGYDQGWEAGGMKATHTVDLIVRANSSHDNHGPGLWTDGDNVNAVYEHNVIANNDGPGIQHEISYRATIHNNVVYGNGRTPHVWGWGAQILVQNSRDVRVFENSISVPDGGNGVVMMEQKREISVFGPHITRDNSVYENRITMDGERGIACALLTDNPERHVEEHGNACDHNQYYGPSPTGHYWVWQPSDTALSFRDFQKFSGQEKHGSFSVTGNAK